MPIVPRNLIEIPEGTTVYVLRSNKTWSAVESLRDCIEIWGGSVDPNSDFAAGTVACAKVTIADNGMCKYIRFPTVINRPVTFDDVTKNDNFQIS